MSHTREIHDAITYHAIGTLRGRTLRHQRVMEHSVFHKYLEMNGLQLTTGDRPGRLPIRNTGIKMLTGRPRRGRLIALRLLLVWKRTLVGERILSSRGMSV